MNRENKHSIYLSADGFNPGCRRCRHLDLAGADEEGYGGQCKIYHETTLSTGTWLGPSWECGHNLLTTCRDWSPGILWALCFRITRLFVK